MSHTSSIKSITITSITALRAAIAELRETGLQISLVENVKPRAYSSNQSGMGVAPFVVRLDTANYDIGLYPDGKGGYEARTDFWGGSVEGALGAPASCRETVDQARMGKLFQAYGIHATMEQAARKGHMVRRVNRADGVAQLEITGSGI